MTRKTTQLSVNRETIRRLSDGELHAAAGQASIICVTDWQQSVCELISLLTSCEIVVCAQIRR